MSNRTRNCLVRQGLHERPRVLENYTIGQLLELPGFGKECLADLIRALNAFSTDAALWPGAVPESPAAAEVVLDEARTLEEELRFLAARAGNVDRPSPTERNVLIAVRYFGLDGAYGATLEEVGNAHGLTRERVRQICRRVEEGIKGKAGAAPVLERALTAVKELLPSAADSIEAKLQEMGVTQGPFRLEALARAAQLLGREAPFALETINGKRMAVVPGQGESVRRTILIARRAIARYGVATTSEIAAMVQERTSYTTTAEFVAGILEGQRDFERLDREAGWFWIRSTRNNRVLEPVRKVGKMPEIAGFSALLAQALKPNPKDPCRRGADSRIQVAERDRPA